METNTELKESECRTWKRIRYFIYLLIYHICLYLCLYIYLSVYLYIEREITVEVLYTKLMKQSGWLVVAVCTHNKILYFLSWHYLV